MSKLGRKPWMLCQSCQKSILFFILEIPNTVPAFWSSKDKGFFVCFFRANESVTLEFCKRTETQVCRLKQSYITESKNHFEVKRSLKIYSKGSAFWNVPFCKISHLSTHMYKPLHLKAFFFIQDISKHISCKNLISLIR